MIRQKPQVAIVLASTKGLAGRLVRWASDSKINHAMIVYEDQLWSGFWKAEAMLLDGVEKRPFDPDDSKYLKLDAFTYRGDIVPGLRSIRNEFGAGYDYAGASIGILRLILGKVTGKLTDVAIHDHDRFFCFELIIHVLQNAGVPGATALAPAVTSPAKLREWLMSHEYFRKISIEWFMEKTSEFPLVEGRQPWQEKRQT